MFFFLSKIFWFVAQPLNFAIFLVLGGMLAVWFGWQKAAASFVSLAALILVLSVWTSLGAVLLRPLEERYPRPAFPENVAGIVVLGGGFEGGINLARGGYELNTGGDRFVEAAILARRYPTAKVVISGGTGALVLDGEADADTAVRLMDALGVERERLILEDESRNTYENAVFTRRLVQPAAGETWLLVTSAFHMPRSMGLFRKADFVVTPWPTDYRTSGKEGFGLLQDNPVDSLQTTTVAVREWMGLIAYRLVGRTDAFLP